MLAHLKCVEPHNSMIVVQRKGCHHKIQDHFPKVKWLGKGEPWVISGRTGLEHREHLYLDLESSNLCYRLYKGECKQEYCPTSNIELCSAVTSGFHFA